MKQPKKLETKKLFYRKYPYKIACSIHGATYVMREGYNAVLKAKEWEHKYGHSTYMRHSRVDFDDLQEFVNAAVPFMEKDNIRVRSEGRHFNLFCLDEATYNAILDKVKKWAYEVTAPKSDKDLQYLLANKALKVIVDQLPYEKYKYKIVLKSSMKSDVRMRLNTWISKYSQDDMHVSSLSTRAWLSGTKNYTQDPFIYVAEDNIRTMVELYLGANKTRTEEFVLRSSI